MKNIKLLEKNMVTYQNLLSVTCKENNEPFVIVDKTLIFCKYKLNGKDMKRFFKNNMYVRKSVYGKLKEANKILQKIDPDLSILLTYGYRSLEVQKKKFLELLSKTNIFYEDPINLYENIHRFIAVPTIAGHPSGGAVDVSIVNTKTKQELHFGSKQYDYSSKKCYVDYPTVSRKGKKNRQLLRKVMLQLGFAPFDGEWWHFSYGDREWAYYYKHPNAIYNQVNAKDLTNFMVK